MAEHAPDARYPLSGFRILDFTANAAGPYATWLLGTLGAEIVKIESTQRQDPTRGIADRPYAHSVFFEDVNCGKRGIDLNLKVPSHVETVLELAATCHAAVDSFRPGVMDRLGVGPRQLQARAPHLVVASLSATGSEGPMAGLPGYAGIFNALGGLGGLTGYPGGPPTELRTSIDLRSGAVFALLVCDALLRARGDGVGRRLDFSAMEAVALLSGEYLAACRLGADAGPDRIGNRDELWSPHGIYPAREGWVAIAVRTGDEWDALRSVLGGGLDRFDDADDRRARPDALDGAVARLTAGHARDDLVRALKTAGVPADPVLGADEVARDPVLEERGFYQQVRGSDGSAWTVASPPWRVGGRRPKLGGAPALGADTRAVLEEVGRTAPAREPGDGPARAVRVAELATGVAAPFATRLLADLGAEVRRVERGHDASWVRTRPPIVEVDGLRAGALYHLLTAGKDLVRVCADDDGDGGGDGDGDGGLGSVVDDLWRWADLVFVDESFLSHRSVRRALDRPGPAAIVAVTPFGLEPDGTLHPWSRIGTSLTAFARCGESSITPGGLGHQLFPDAAPLAARGKVAELDAGIMAALVGLGSSRRTGDGPPVLVDVSVYETEVSNNRWIPGNFTHTGWIETRESRPYPFGGLMPCNDGHAMFLPSTDRIWRSFVEIMGAPEWAQAEALATRPGREERADEVRARITEWASSVTKDELLRWGLDKGVPIGPYRTASEVAACPQLEHRGFFVPYGTDDGSLPGLPAPGITAGRHHSVLRPAPDSAPGSAPS